MREAARLLPGALGLRAEDVRARAGRGRHRDRGLQAGLLPPGSGSLPRGDRDEAVARDEEEPEAAEAPASATRTSRSSSSTSATSSAWQTDTTSTSPHKTRRARRGLSQRRGDPGARVRARSRDRPRLRGPRADPRLVAEDERLLPGRPLAGGADPARDRLHRARRLRGQDEAVGRAADQGPRRLDHRPRRLARRGRRRHRAHAELRVPDALAPRAGLTGRGHVPRPSVPPPRRRPARRVRRLHRPGRVLRRLRLRPRRALPPPAGPAPGPGALLRDSRAGRPESR